MPLPDRPPASAQVSTSKAECPLGLCDGSGWIMRRVEGDYWRQEASECMCLLQREREERRRRLLASAEVPAEFENATIENLDDRHARAKSVCRRYVEAWPDEHGKGLLFVGDVGVGKTTMAFAVFNDVLHAHNINAIACNGARLLRDLARGITDRMLDVRMDELARCDLLLLDDIAAHRTATLFAAESMYQIVNERWSHQRPTIYTAMYDVPAWGSTDDPKIAQMWRAIGSRVLSRSEAFLLSGPDRRLEKGDR